MANISVATYEISVRKKYSHTRQPLDNFEGADLFVFLQKYLEDRFSPINDKTHKSVFTAHKPNVLGRQISGIISTGEYGFESVLLDTQNNKPSYRRKKTDAAMLPFFYLFDLPKGQTSGLVVLQRFKTYGIRRMLAGDFSKYFEQHYPHSSVHIYPIAHPKLMSQFDGASTNKIRLRKFLIPQDICDQMKNGTKPTDGYVEYSIIAKKGKGFNLADKIFNRNDNQMLVIETPHFKAEKTLVEVKMNGRTRTLDVADPTKVRSYFDITEEVKIADDGHPKVDSILKISQALLVDIWAIINGRENVQ